MHFKKLTKFGYKGTNFTVKIHEYHSSSELKLAIWCQMRMHAKKYFERKNTIG